MIYGDDPLTLNNYNYSPSLVAIIRSGNLYVYAMNNPTRYTDPTGELVWPGEIHNEVVNRIARDYDLYKEQHITYRSGIGSGRADLISKTGEVWDVKRDKPNQIASGVKQVKKYVSNTWTKNPDPDNIALSVGGTADTQIASGSFTYKSGATAYYVTYRDAGDGVIAYDYSANVDWGKVGETLAGVALLAGSAYLIYQTGGVAAPILVPVLS